MADIEIMDAVKQAIEGSKERKFKESVELAFNLKDIDLSVPKNRVDMEIILPKGRGKVVKIGIFGSGELAIKAKKVADSVFQPEDIEDLGKDKKSMRKIANSHGFFIAEAPLMPTIGKKLGVVLGPRGKMPKPIPSQAEPGPLVKNLKNTIKVRSKDRMTFHAPVGTRDMKVEDLVENIQTVVQRIERQLEKGRMNLKSVFVKTSMGPAVRII
jgi:large subunit ribosomal protein L1